MSGRRTILALTVVLVALSAASAHAAYGPGADIVSADYQRLEQGDDATSDAAITPDGRYVILQTRATNFFAEGDPDPDGLIRRGGIFRFDRKTRQLALVADGTMYDANDGSLVLRGAANPSVSADGRFVAFSTAQRLVPQDTNDAIDVYVRDMDVPIGSDRAASGAYTLVSAQDGGDTPATYTAPAVPLAGGNPGADVWRNTAISADGTKVAFRTAPDQLSTLPDHAAPDVPGGQIFVRDLAAHRTTLVTQDRADGSPAGGAAGPVVLSGDGSTVVWVGAHAPAQTRFLNGEHIDPDVNFYLWRRLDGTATRRITGLADPDDPACDGTPVTLNATAVGPCYGPLTNQEEDGASLANVTPAVSQDGNRVAFLTTGGLRPTSINNPGLDLFLTDMRPGVTRKAGTLELTRDGTSLDARATAGIDAVAMSADGQHLVVATARTNFLLPTFAPVGVFRSVVSAEELYVFDLNARTIDRVVRGLDGGDANGDAGPSPTLTTDGATVAFTSKATNLFYGDANGVADAFVTSLVPPVSSGTVPPSDGGTNTGDGFFVAPDPTLDMDWERRRDGGLDVSLTVPAAGVATVTASASVARARAGKSTTVVVGTGRKTVKKAGTIVVVVTLAKKYASLLRKSKRVAVTITPSFLPTGAKTPVTDAAQPASFVRPTVTKKTTKKKTTTKKKQATKKTPTTKKSS